MRVLLTGLLLLAAWPSSAQENLAGNPANRRSSFIGISIGPSFAVGKYAEAKDTDLGAGAGAHLNLINFGHLFNERIGIAAKWYGGSNLVKLESALHGEENNFDPWAYGGILAGPMVSIPFSSSAP